MKKLVIVALAAATAIATPALAYEFPVWIGKGSVQTALGYNNAQLQRGTYEFAINEENEWTCSKPHPTQDRDIVQERNSTVSGLFFSIARENSKGKDGPITGFWLTGFNGDVQTNGPETGSCADAHSGFVFDADSLVTTGGGITVNGVPLD